MSRRRFNLHVGTGVQNIEVPFEHVSLGQTRTSVPKPLAIERELPGVLNNSLGSVDLAKLNTDSQVVIVCDDYTRPTPTQVILPELIKFLKQQQVPTENIKILVAAGFHRPMTYGEKITKYGQDICNAFDIYHHDALDDDNLSYLGKSALDVPVYINRLAVEADFLIGVGLVEIHPWAGFAGGPKIICPGIAGKKTIDCTHALPVTERGVVIGETRGNPFWETSLEAARMAGLDMVINVVLDVNEEIVGIYAGEAEVVQAKCIGLFRGFNELVFDEAADIVITSANPKYQYWGQAAIAGYNAAAVVRKGGTRIVLADCPEGFGDSQQEIVFYFDSLRDRWEDLAIYWEEKQGTLYDNSRNACAVHRHLVHLQDSDMIMVSKGFPPSTPVMQSQQVVKTFDEAIEMVLERYGEEAKVIVCDMGGMVLCKLRP